MLNQQENVSHGNGKKKWASVGRARGVTCRKDVGGIVSPHMNGGAFNNSNIGGSHSQKDSPFDNSWIDFPTIFSSHLKIKNK
jgi:hypothetical protein